LIEQREIVRRIETTFQWFENVILEVDRSNALLDRLDQSILEKAFRGELVPHDDAKMPPTVAAIGHAFEAAPGRVMASD
jgi:type I restriction enzyme S subunit